MTAHALLDRPAPVTGAGAAVDAAVLEHSLALGARLVSAAEAFAAQLAVPELGDIELPPALGGAADQASLRAAAPIYLASELESTLLLQAVELMAGLFVSGGLSTDLGPAAELLAHFWRNRRERLSIEERQAIFARLFGRQDGPPVASEDGCNVAFEELLLNLVEALIRLDDSPLRLTESAAGAQARIWAAAQALAGNLAPRSAGLAAFAARDLLQTLQSALNILQQPAAQHAVGANSVWLAVGNVAQRYLGQAPDFAARITRGRAGQSILAWLAGRLPHFESSGAVLASSGDPVVAAAHAWLEASLALVQPAPGAAGAS